MDRDDPLPASALKGLMRAAARVLLPGTGTDDHALVAAVFGMPRRASPWNWGPAVPSTRLAVHTRAQVRVDEGGAAARDMLRFGEEVWARTAEFDIVQCGPVDEPARHELLLACTAQAVHALGSDRRRGLGWVTVRSLDRPVAAADITELFALRTADTITSPGGAR